jgi:hypothetical protein
MNSDAVMMILISVIAAGWLYWRFRRWIETPARRKLPLEPEDVPDDEAVRLLEENGYEVIAGKRKLSVKIRVDNENVLFSRLYIDYIVRKRGEMFVAKLAQERAPLERTGSVLADKLLVYQLIYDHCAGVLYIHPDERRITEIRFEWDTEEE